MGRAYGDNGPIYRSSHIFLVLSLTMTTSRLIPSYATLRDGTMVKVVVPNPEHADPEPDPLPAADEHNRRHNHRRCDGHAFC